MYESKTLNRKHECTCLPVHPLVSFRFVSFRFVLFCFVLDTEIGTPSRLFSGMSSCIRIRFDESYQ